MRRTGFSSCSPSLFEKWEGRGRGRMPSVCTIPRATPHPHHSASSHRVTSFPPSTSLSLLLSLLVSALFVVPPRYPSSLLSSSHSSSPFLPCLSSLFPPSLFVPALLLLLLDVRSRLLVVRGDRSWSNRRWRVHPPDGPFLGSIRHCWAASSRRRWVG